MAEVYIQYSNLSSAIDCSVKAREKIDDYMCQMGKAINLPIGNLHGADSSGYVQSAANLAREKVARLMEKKQYFSNFENTARRVLTTAKDVDSTVSRQISAIAETYVEKRKWYEKAGDWIYNTFCVDMTNHFSLVRDFVDGIKWLGDKAENYIEKIHNWFKYGDGQYIWKIGKAIVSIGVAVVGTIGAIVSIPFSGGLSIPFVIGLVGAIATTVGGIITVGNSVSNIYTSGKALSLSGNPFDDDDGNPGAARYYGSSNKMSEAFNKFDFGDAETNKKYQNAGEIIDTTKTVADATALVCNIASLGNVRDFRVTAKNDNINFRYNAGQWNKGYDFSWVNIKRNLLHDMGFKITSGQLKEGSLGINLVDKGTVFKNSGLFSESAVNVFRTIKTADNIVNFVEGVDGLYDFATESNKTFPDTVTMLTHLTGALKTPKFFGSIDKYITKGYKNADAITKLLTGSSILKPAEGE